MEPRRFGPRRANEERVPPQPDVKPLHSMLIKNASKLLGNYTKKPSTRKPKIHDRSFRPSDITYFLESSRRRGVTTRLDHDFHESFFDEAGGTNPTRKPLVSLPKRHTLILPSSSNEFQFDDQPSRPRAETTPRRRLTKVAPYESPRSSAKYKSGEDVVPVAGPWVIKTRSCLRKKQKNKANQSQSSLSKVADNPPKVIEPVSGDHEETEVPGSEEGRESYNRVEEVMSKQDELLPVPPKLPKMRMRRKVGLQSFSKAPSIGRGDSDEADDGERLFNDDGGDTEVDDEKEEVQHLGDASQIDGQAKANDGAEFAEVGEHGGQDETDGKFVEFVQGIWDNSDRASIGMKLTRKCFGFSTTSPTEKVVGRPFFTVWITLIQMIIFIIIVSSYGIAPVDVDWKEQNAEVLMTDLSIQLVSYNERSNLWVGPRESDLIHLGAKFAPCIRPDKNVAALLEKDRQSESTTGCCVNNDGSGCVQTMNSDCSRYISTWFQGTVCGEDPKYCGDPGSYAWGKDITKWPICKNTLKVPSDSQDYHMMCQVVGRPCCVGVQGECVMATREFCSFRRGYFHENASLCSQVSCLNDVCGMISFTDPQKPDQYYRFFTSLCVLPGILALVISCLFQWIIQFDLERYIGTLAMAVVYVGSGYCGSVLSAIFIPYYVEAGPSGSQFGVLAAMTVEIIRWNAEEKPRAQLVIIFISLIILFVIGIIVPEVDNWAHLGGYVVGLLLSIGFRFGYFNVCGLPNYCVIITRVLCFVWAAAVAAILTVVFYLIEVKQCDGCLYFNCVPFTDTYCIGMGVNITTRSITN